MGTKNHVLSRQVQSTLNLLQQERFASHSDYLLHRLDCLVYHSNHYSPVLESDDVLQLYVKQGWLCCHCIHSPADFSSAYKVGVTFSGVPGRSYYAISREHLLFFFLDHRFTIPETVVLLGMCRKRRPKIEDRTPCGLKQRPTGLKRGPACLKRRPCRLKRMPYGLK